MFLLKAINKHPPKRKLRKFGSCDTTEGHACNVSRCVRHIDSMLCFHEIWPRNFYCVRHTASNGAIWLRRISDRAFRSKHWLQLRNYSPVNMMVGHKKKNKVMKHSAPEFYKFSIIQLINSKFFCGLRAQIGSTTRRFEVSESHTHNLYGSSKRVISLSRRSLLTYHTKKHNRRISMRSAGFERAILAIERPQTCTFDRIGYSMLLPDRNIE